MQTIEEKRTEFFSNLHGIVEATSFEILCIYEKYHQGKKYSWEDLQLGTFFKIGEINDLPICFQITPTKINGKNILFYEACSRMVDYDIVDKFIAENYKSKNLKTNAMNFRNALCD